LLCHPASGCLYTKFDDFSFNRPSGMTGGQKINGSHSIGIDGSSASPIVIGHVINHDVTNEALQQQISFYHQIYCRFVELLVYQQMSAEGGWDGLLSVGCDLHV